METIFIACVIFALLVGAIPFLPVSKDAKRNMTIVVALALLFAVATRLWLLPAIAGVPKVDVW